MKIFNENSCFIPIFCAISGMLFSYTLFQLGYWWLLHTALLFWKVIFPFHSRAYEMSGKMKKVHIAIIMVGMLLPLTPIITSMAKFAVDVQKRATNETSATELFLSGGLGYLYCVQALTKMLCSTPLSFFWI